MRAIRPKTGHQAKALSEAANMTGKPRPLPAGVNLPPAEMARTALAHARAAAMRAGEIALAHFRPGGRTSARLWHKDGGSPVTEADLAADAYLKAELGRLWPQAAWLSEETADTSERLGAALVWIVDPIDGTRAFLEGERDWCVSIALLAHGQPVAGVLEAPALGQVYTAMAGQGALLNGTPMAVSNQEQLSGAHVAGPRPAIEALARLAPGIRPGRKVPSLALRIARIAQGAFDAGLVSSDAHDWDLAAADLILTEAGGTVTTTGGARLIYNAREPVHGPLVASGPRLHAELAAAARKVEGQGQLGRNARLP